MKKHLEKLNKNEVEKIYFQTNSLKETAKIIGCGRSKLQAFCAENNIKHTFSINHNVFSSINENNCYWAGFIASDGCVYKNFVKVVLHDTDAEHLVKLYNFLNSQNNPVIKK